MFSPRHRVLSLVTPLCLFFAEDVRSQIKLPAIVGDGMVLQQGMSVPIWGWDIAGQKVTVAFGGQKLTATAGEDGRWQVDLAAMKSSAKGRALKVSGSDRVTVKDVLVGEVWICSGQSNMEWRLAQVINGKEEVANAKNPLIRLFNVPGHTVNARPQSHGKGSWAACQPKSAKGFSAVGYFFGRRLATELKVPIGLVGSNWGGTRIEPWVSLDGFRSVPELSKLADAVVEQAAENSKVGGRHPAAIFNSMVSPLAPFAMRGGIWYQGESNGNEGESYFHKTKALVNGWRKLFNPDLAFYWVQLANFRKPNPEAEGGKGWSKLREAQRKALTIPHTGMAVITDIGAEKNIHPKNKQDVGWRLSQWALCQTYGRTKLVPCGPLYKGHAVEGNSIRVSFDHVGGGLMVGEKNGLAPTKPAKGTKLEYFAIAGADKKWFWADAKIDGSDIVLTCAEVEKPVAVRYAYAMNPVGANLYNKEGIPASPFRTDDW
jgi:sialate O-acetylesterase